nr:sulfurtransferase TusA family protein [Actinotalea subterranea]
MVVDARGLRCPLPVIRLAAAARDAAPGTDITVIWTDPAARHDIPAWARMRGHEVRATAPLAPPDAAPGPDGPDAFATTVRTAG